MTKRANLTAAEKEFAATKRELGWSIERIAQHLKCSPGAIAWHCLALGADPPNARPIDKAIRGPLVVMRNGKCVRRFTPDDDAVIQAMSLAGAGDSTIGAALGRQPNSIRGRLMTLARHEARAELGVAKQRKTAA